MDSNQFFEDKDFNSRWKGKSGIYILECPLFTKYTGYPVFKTGFAKDSLYTRISNYRTAYGLVPFKIHLLYHIPQGIRNVRPNYANLTERVLQETARKYGEYAGVGEWFKELPLLLNICFTIRTDHFKRHKQAGKWDFWTMEKYNESLKEIELVSEDEISGSFKELVVGKHNTRASNIEEDDETELYEDYVKKNVRSKLPKRFEGFDMGKK